MLHCCWDLIFPEAFQPCEEDFITLGVMYFPSLAPATGHSSPFLFQTCARWQPPALDFTLAKLVYPATIIKCPSISTVFDRMKAMNTSVYLASLSFPLSLPCKSISVSGSVEFWETETYQRSPLMGDTDMFTDNSNVLFRCHAGRLFRIQGGVWGTFKVSRCA